MATRAASLDQRVQFLRRGPGGYVPVGAWQWARYEFERGALVTIGSINFRGRSGRLTVRRCTQTESLRDSDICDMNGERFIITVRRTSMSELDDLQLEIESAPGPLLYETEMERSGEVIIIRRPRANQPALEAQVRARVTGYAPDELVGGINQGDSKVIALAADLEAGGITLPLKTGVDKVIIRGRTRTIEAVDDNTHTFAGELLAYVLTVRG